MLSYLEQGMTWFGEGWKGIVEIFQNIPRRLIIYLLETCSGRQVTILRPLDCKEKAKRRRGGDGTDKKKKGKYHRHLCFLRIDNFTYLFFCIKLLIWKVNVGNVIHPSIRPFIHLFNLPHPIMDMFIPHIHSRAWRLLCVEQMLHFGHSKWKDVGPYFQEVMNKILWELKKKSKQLLPLRWDGGSEWLSLKRLS